MDLPRLHKTKEIVYNSIMTKKKRYTSAIRSAAEIRRMQDDFFRKAGPAAILMADLFETMPNIALTLKDAKGRIVYTNRYNARISGWESPADQIGYTSEELYPPDQAAVYGGRDREVMESGEPIVERVYGFVADRSTALNCVTIRPVNDMRGRRIGTATMYWRAEHKLAVTNWYDPIRKAIVYLNEHFAESVSVEQLAALAGYSPAQFRRLFNALTQMSPSKYVISVRINAAKTLLSTTDRHITDIACETGFYDHAHFIRAFKSATGQTPNEFRQQVLVKRGSRLQFSSKRMRML